MGSLLVGILLASNRHAHQVREADRRLSAVRIADQLLAQWYGTPLGVPVPATGEIAAAERERFVWQTTMLAPILSEDDSQPLPPGLSIVRLEVRYADAETDGRPLAAVELVYHPPRPNDVAEGANGPR